MFSATYDGERGESVGESIIQSNAEKYRMYEKFTFKCIGCKTDNVIVKPFIKVDGKFVPVLESCTNKECSWSPIDQLQHIRNQLSLAIRKAIRTYYDNWLICDYPNCNQSTRTFVHVSLNHQFPQYNIELNIVILIFDYLTVSFAFYFHKVADSKGHPICLTCKRGHLMKCYSEGDLYKQLKYFQFMFDLPKFEQTCKKTYHTTINSILEMSILIFGIFVHVFFLN